MPGSWLEQFLRGANASTVTEIFIFVMLAVLVFSVLQGRKGKHDLFLEHAPAVLVSLGILGTFVGIVIGLLDFDATNIRGSIEELLEGLKTAFITSLVGMSLSITLKALDTWWFGPTRMRADVPDMVTPEHMYGAMKRQVELLEALGQSLSGSEEGSVAGQLKLLRTDISDFRNGIAKDHREFETQLFAHMDDFAKMLAKSATETVIEALRQVIEDFNKHLVEQFGDNFKALDSSVKKLVEWQVEYRNHLEAMESRLELAIGTLERSAAATEQVSVSLAGVEQSIVTIDGECQKIPPVMESLGEVMAVNQHQLNGLEQHLEAFKAMREAATKAVPEIQEHVERLSQELAERLKGVASIMHEGALEFGKSADRTNAALAETSHVISTQSEQISSDLKDSAEGFSRSSRETLEALSNGANAFIDQMEKAVAEAADAMSSEFKRVVGRIGETVGSAVDDSMATLKTTVESSLSDTQHQVQGAANRTLGAVEAQIQEATERANESLRAQLNAMDRAIERELQKVFSEMGSALATISRRIADDHAEYTARVTS